MSNEDEEVNTTRIKVTSQGFPTAKSVWEVEIGIGSPLQQLAYNNLAFDLVAASMAKLGAEYSKWLAGTSTDEQFDEEMTAVQKYLAAGVVA
jgi:hypothetical protein